MKPYLDIVILLVPTIILHLLPFLRIMIYEWRFFIFQNPLVGFLQFGLHIQI